MVNHHVKIYLVLITVYINVEINVNIQITQNNVYLKLIVICSKYQIVLKHMEINCKMLYFVIL